METPKKRSALNEQDAEVPSPVTPTPSTPGVSGINFWALKPADRQVKRLKIDKLETKADDIRDDPSLSELKPRSKPYTIKMRVSVRKMGKFGPRNDRVLWVTGNDNETEVTLVAFSQNAERFWNDLKPGKALEITNVKCVDEKGRYTTVSGFPFSLKLQANSEISPLCPNEIFNLEFNFEKKIGELKAAAKDYQNGDFVDLLAVVCMIDELKEGPFGSYRRIYLTDDSMETIMLTLNGWEAENLTDEEEFVAAFRKFRLGFHDGNPILKGSERSAIVRDAKRWPEGKALWDFFVKKKLEATEESTASQEAMGESQERQEAVD